MGEIISGKELSREVREEVRVEVANLKATYGAVPHLVVVLVGNDPASESYVKAKKRACIRAGMESTIIRKESDIAEEELLSIINNAREAVRKSDKVNKIIKIRTCTDSYRKSIEIEVIDNGVGIPEDIRGKIFQPFFTTTDALSATGKPTEGPGLGLAIACRIIENHQGNIKVESVVGEGTMFTVLIPVLDVAVLERGYVARVDELTSHYYAGE